MSEKQDKDLYPKQYLEKRPGFVVKSGTRDAAGKNIDYAVFTDNSQGFEYTQEGNKFDVTNKCSSEVCGEFVGKDEVAKSTSMQWVVILSSTLEMVILFSRV